MKQTFTNTFINSVLRYGEYVIDKEYTTWDNHNYRLRAIRYNDKLYWHEMVDGKVIDFRG